MKSFRSDFPIFSVHPELVFLDSASSAQKPAKVIDAMAEYQRTSYANIHRGAYELSERSELLYRESKVAMARWIGVSSHYDIVYSNNATGAFNLLANSMARSGWLKSGDRVLLSIVEHHANIVPWMMLKETHGIEVEFVAVNAHFELDREDFIAKLTPNTKVISFTGCSNVTGVGIDFETVNFLLNTNWKSDWGRLPYRVMDASQLVAHAPLDVTKLELDFAIFTGHKVWADTGIGVLYGKRELLKSLVPSIGGGGAINFVHTDAFEVAGLPFRFEPGTPNLTGAISLLSAFQYFESIGGYTTIMEMEQELVGFALTEFAKRSPKIRLIGPDVAVTSLGKPRAGVFSFVVADKHPNDIADGLADKQICVRAGHHCTEPFHRSLGIHGTVRMSFSLYTTKSDVKRFFEVLDTLI